VLLNLSKIKALWDKLLRTEASPNQIASGFSWGLLVSFLPFPGFQTLLGLGGAFLFRTNKVASLIGLNLHLVILPVIPLIFWVEYEIGKFLLGMWDAPDFNPTNFSFRDLFREGWRYFYFTLVGSFVLGVPVSAAAFWGARQFVIRWQKARQDANNDSAVKPPEIKV